MKRIMKKRSFGPLSNRERIRASMFGPLSLRERARVRGSVTRAVSWMRERIPRLRPHPRPLSQWERGGNWGVLALVVVATCLCVRPAAGAETPAVFQKMGFDQRLNQQVPLDLPFVDETGKAVMLRDYFGEKPVILVLAYFHCPMLCTMVLNGLSEALREIPFTIGKEFNVLTVSFNPRETWQLAAAKKRTYIAHYGRPGAAEGWHFLTGKQESIDKLTQAVGFHYVYDAQKDQYYHPAGIMVLTPAGKVSRYFYDVRFVPRDLKLGLMDASADKIGSPTDQVLLYCCQYDPKTGKYSANVMMLVRAGGVLTIVGLTVMVGFLMYYQRRRQRHGGAAASQAAAGGAEEQPPTDGRGDE